MADPFPIWERLRNSACPVGRSPAMGGAWLTVRHEDVEAIVRDPGRFSSSNVGVIPRPPEDETSPLILPPLTSDPPMHAPARRPLLSWFSPQRASQYESSTRELCADLADRFAATGGGDAVAAYAAEIPVHVISAILGVPPEDGDIFKGWLADLFHCVDDQDRRAASRDAVFAYLAEHVARRTEAPEDDLVSALVHMQIDGERIPHDKVLGTVALLLIAGIDTTAAAIASSLWHLATHPGDRLWLAAEPRLIDSAVEEFLRAYSPVTMARIATQDLELSGCPIAKGDRVLINFPAANRDPAVFPQPNEVRIERSHNRHVAFGMGIHRCLGSHFARMQLRVALTEWLARIPEFHLDPAAGVEWTVGQVRGPRSLPICTEP